MSKFLRNSLFFLWTALSIIVVSCKDVDEQPPIISFVSPLAASVGDTVTITGFRLEDTYALYIGGWDATIINKTETSIITTVPAKTEFWDDKIDVSTPNGTTYHSFTVLAPVPPPIITAIDPAEGEIGTVINITGTNLANASCVIFDSTKSCLIANTETSITTTVPVGAAKGSQIIIATTPSGVATQMFTVK